MRYRIRFHPSVRRDIEVIADLLADYSGVEVARSKLGEIRATIHGLAATPHTGSIRGEIAPGVRAIPAGRKGVVVFRVDDATETLFILAVTYGGADWIGKLPGRVLPGT